MTRKRNGTIRYTLLIEHDADEGYIISVNELPGVFATGTTEEQAIRNVQKAIRIHVRMLRKHVNEITPRPKLLEVEV